MRRKVAAVVAVLVLLLGCGTSRQNANTARLKGQITINGEDLPEDAEGYIQFMPSGGGQAAPTSTEILDGKYELDNVPLGSVNVILNITRLTGRMVREDNAPGATPYPEREDLVPAKHRSGIQIQVEGDNDAMDIDL